MSDLIGYKIKRKGLASFQTVKCDSYEVVGPPARYIFRRGDEVVLEIPVHDLQQEPEPLRKISQKTKDQFQKSARKASEAIAVQPKLEQ